MPAIFCACCSSSFQSVSINFFDVILCEILGGYDIITAHFSKRVVRENQWRFSPFGSHGIEKTMRIRNEFE